ncbi:MAG: CPBP family intramembrane metalloprotease [Candidatus Glassbacteria bacterium]|nr:CPBP family intramembrane metalloprotease [Candidatus Glassbacteria bacterium]
MFTPLISASITQKLIFRQNVMRPLRVSFLLNRWFLVALLLPDVLALGSTAASLLFPGVSLTVDPTEASIFEFLGNSLPKDQLATLSRSVTELPMHPFLLVLLGGTIAGLTINGIAGFGEELGWRGLLLRELAGLGFWRASFTIGLIWGLWHLPFILHGYNYPGYPIAGVFMMIVWTVLFSPLIAYVSIRSNSVIPAAIMHGALNGTAMAPAIVLKGGDALQVGVMGFAGMLVLFCFNVALLVLCKPTEWHNKWMERTLDSAAHP